MGSREDAVRFGLKLRELRREVNGTLDQVAASIHVDRSAISKIETGKLKRPPVREEIEAMAEALDVPALPLLMAAGYVISIGTDELDVAEAEILETVRGLTTSEKDRIRRMLRGGYG